MDEKTKETVRAELAERYRQLLLANREVSNETRDYTQEEVVEYQNRVVRMLELFSVIQWLDRQVDSFYRNIDDIEDG